MILASSEIAGCILWRNARLPPPYIYPIPDTGRGSPLAYHIKAPRPKSKPPFHPPGEEALPLITSRPSLPPPASSSFCAQR
ncbi:hypothetical protein IX296_002996 [Bacteroides pyogenes]|nr:hypothetical protein [Bacteroides pyogenes]MBR8740000.1 hypothetical protein [Bacteroides pyogenes]MBR8755762.1 hypothetical protein [Bacteroides pyogenes]MBR8797066.1 hypothetical protein [Bacteroides pyogenes]MBR8810675.1 hypothetical protein [Bacteroides pyogenes]